jgi:FkbM family methyltransferase
VGQTEAPQTEAPPPEAQTPTRTGFSAYGEDIFVISWFNHFSIDLRTVRYLDIGAAHPWKINNTFALYQHGARGVLVEPDPDQAKLLEMTRSGDVVLNAGGAFDDQKSAELIRMTAGVFNTFSDEQAELVVSSSAKWQPDQRQAVRDRIEIPLLTINEIIEKGLKNECPDFISIDAESKDIDIIRKLDLERFRPLIVCMEALRDRTAADQIFLPHGYIVAANTPDNFLYMMDPYGPCWTERAAKQKS